MQRIYQGSLRPEYIRRFFNKANSASSKEIQLIDEDAIKRLGIPRILLMEHAGLAIAHLAAKLIKNKKPHEQILIFCGTGYNGGDGLSAARHLLNFGFKPYIFLIGKIDALKEEPAAFAKILKSIGVPIFEINDISQIKTIYSNINKPGLIIDALLGMGLKGKVRPFHKKAIDFMNKAAKQLISVDIPSGLNGDNARPMGCAVKADATITFGLPKKGFFKKSASIYTGKIYLDRISLPEMTLSIKRHKQIKK